MNRFEDLLEPKVQKFINTHVNDDIVKLIFKGSPFDHVDIQQIAQQIKGKQVAKYKFTGLYNHPDILYPPSINLEQASSEQTAVYKSNLIEQDATILDLTGGLGIDSLAFTTKSKSVTYCEINSATFNYAAHNFNVLQKNINTLNSDGIRYLEQAQQQFDWIYIDPARRDASNKKVFRFEDCTPNILAHMELFKSKSKKLLIKTSPILDINYVVNTFANLSEIHIVAVKNEVKELLGVLDFENNSTRPLVKAVNLESLQDDFEDSYENIHSPQEFSLPLKYLYEPNAAIMKSGFFGALCKNYGVTALAVNSHLFTSDRLIDFPGRVFKIKHRISPQKKEVKKHLPRGQANVSSRNYPLKPEQIKDKYKLRDGGSKFVFFTESIQKEKIVLICKKIN